MMTNTALIPLPLSTAVESAKQRQVRETFFYYRDEWDDAIDGFRSHLCGTCALGGALLAIHPDLEEELGFTLDDLDSHDFDKFAPDVDRPVPMSAVPKDVRPHDWQDTMNVGTVVMRLNDDACWTRQQIAAWLRSIGF